MLKIMYRLVKATAHAQMRRSFNIRHILSWKPLCRFIVLFIVTFAIIWISFDRINPKINEFNAQNFPDDVDTLKYGHLGEPVTHSKDEEEAVQDSYRLYGFNQYISDKISINRKLKDMRHPDCLLQKFPHFKARVSVIIVFYDEGWSTLWRTVRSVINTSPRHLLHEIILVDDHSTLFHLKTRLDDEVKKYKGFIKIVRLPKHDGLIMARTAGSDAATGDYLIFLDSHCEATVGWLEPLIYPITLDYRVINCPTIDGIEHDTFAYHPYGGRLGHVARGTFSWQFYYKERDLTEEQKRKRKNLGEPVASPVMAGGLFAISKKWWIELGKYDPGLFIWGGEQYELSFKVWMCGGSMYNLPCSHVGHVYRGPGLHRNQQDILTRHPNSININYKRVAEVWMDDYKHFLYMKLPHVKDAEDYDIGLQERHELRKNLKCKSFRWYLENIVADTLYTAYEPDRAWDVIKNSYTDKCISNNGGVSLKPCSYSTSYRWTWINEIRDDEHCLTVDSGRIKNDWCHEKQYSQHFLYKSDTKQIYADSFGLCLSAEAGDRLVLEKCESDKKEQMWEVNLRDLTKKEPWAYQGISPPRNP